MRGPGAASPGPRGPHTVQTAPRTGAQEEGARLPDSIFQNDLSENIKTKYCLNSLNTCSSVPSLRGHRNVTLYVNSVSTIAKINKWQTQTSRPAQRVPSSAVTPEKRRPACTRMLTAALVTIPGHKPRTCPAVGGCWNAQHVLLGRTVHQRKGSKRDTPTTRQPREALLRRPTSDEATASSPQATQLQKWGPPGGAGPTAGTAGMAQPGMAHQLGVRGLHRHCCRHLKSRTQGKAGPGVCLK